MQMCPHSLPSPWCTDRVWGQLQREAVDALVSAMCAAGRKVLLGKHTGLCVRDNSRPRGDTSAHFPQEAKGLPVRGAVPSYSTCPADSHRGSHSAPCWYSGEPLLFHATPSSHLHLFPKSLLSLLLSHIQGKMRVGSWRDHR